MKKYPQLAAACPWCLNPIGVPCVRPSGRYANGPHQARHEEYMKAKQHEERLRQEGR